MTINSSSELITVLTAWFALAVFSRTCIGGFLEGAIGFHVTFTPARGTGANLGDATGINIVSSQVIDANGDFTPTVGLGAVFNQVDFNPASTPISGFWSVNAGATTYSFDLLDISLDFQDTDQLNLSGNGILMANGFDDTPGAWTFSGQQGSIFLTFSSITAAQDITEPNTVFLLGLGILGLAYARKRVS